METFRVDTGGGELACARFGSGEPLLACHALAFSKQFFVDAADVLGERYDVVAIDQRGHGESASVGNHESLQDLAAELGTVMDHVGWDRAVLGGISLGAALTLSFTALHPERVVGLIQDLPAFSPRSAMADERAAAIAEALAAGDAPGALDTIAAGLPRVAGRALREELERRWSRYPDLAPKLATAFAAIRRWQVLEEWPQALTALTMPVHVFGLMGDKSHPITVAQEMVSWLPHATLYDRAPTLSPSDGVRAWTTL